MQTFAAQVKTGDTDLEVSITLSGRNVQIDSGSDRLGTWTTKECRFERLAPRAYEIRLPQEKVHVHIPDDKGFRAALELVRQEQGALVPRPLLWVGLGTVVAAVFVSALIGGKPAVEAHQSDTRNVIVPSPTPPSPPVPTTARVEPVDPPVEAHPNILDRWNEIADGTPLELDDVGRNELDDVVVTVGDGRVVVEASPSGTVENADMIMGALGIAVASADPDAAPAERAAVLSDLGLRIHAPNATELHTKTTRGDVRYALDFEPGVSVRLEARRDS